jgi:hypothetical protein
MTPGVSTVPLSSDISPVLADVIVFVNVFVPNLDPPATNKPPLTPTPPVTTKAPVVEEVVLVLFVIETTPAEDIVEDAVNDPTDVNEVWNVEAPVIPKPPEVTNRAAECEATPVNIDVDPNTAAPDTPNPEPALIFPETPRPPTIVTAPLVDDVELVLELNTLAPLTVKPPVTPNPPEVILTLVANVATPL